MRESASWRSPDGTAPWRLWGRTPSRLELAQHRLLATVPQTRVPVYTSLVRMKRTALLVQSFPVALEMPSPLRVRAISSIPFPVSASSKIRLTT